MADIKPFAGMSQEATIQALLEALMSVLGNQPMPSPMGSIRVVSGETNLSVTVVSGITTALLGTRQPDSMPIDSMVMASAHLYNFVQVS